MIFYFAASLMPQIVENSTIFYLQAHFYAI